MARQNLATSFVRKGMKVLVILYSAAFAFGFSAFCACLGITTKNSYWSLTLLSCSISVLGGLTFSIATDASAYETALALAAALLTAYAVYYVVGIRFEQKVKAKKKMALRVVHFLNQYYLEVVEDAHNSIGSPVITKDSLVAAKHRFSGFDLATLLYIEANFAEIGHNRAAVDLFPMLQLSGAQPLMLPKAVNKEEYVINWGDVDKHIGRINKAYLGW